jgi:hypothetical protein
MFKKFSKEEGVSKLNKVKSSVQRGVRGTGGAAETWLVHLLITLAPLQIASAGHILGSWKPAS